MKHLFFFNCQKKRETKDLADARRENMLFCAASLRSAASGGFSVVCWHEPRPSGWRAVVWSSTLTGRLILGFYKNLSWALLHANWNLQRKETWSLHSKSNVKLHVLPMSVWLFPHISPKLCMFKSIWGSKSPLGMSVMMMCAFTPHYMLETGTSDSGWMKIRSEKSGVITRPINIPCLEVQFKAEWQTPILNRREMAFHSLPQ